MTSETQIPTAWLEAPFALNDDYCPLCGKAIAECGEPCENYYLRTTEI